MSTYQKHTVCADCFAVGITQIDCRCTYMNNYPTVELEFEVCKCCGQLLDDGSPANTPFNDESITKFRESEKEKK